jgi:DNA end-binding protein Ku
MRNKEYLVTVRPDGSDGVLVLHTMYFPDEVRSPAEELPNLPGEESFSERELGIASQLIEAMTAPWDAERYSDTHRARVEELVASKHEGHEIVLLAPAPAPKVVDLMAALEASVKAAGGGGGRSAAPAKAAKKAAPAREAKAKSDDKPAETQRRAARKRAS